MRPDTMAAADDDYDLDPPGRRRRRGLLWLTLGAVVLAGGGTGYWFTVREPDAQAAGGSAGPAATDRVRRQTISATETWSGKLGHGTPFTVTASGAGTVTRLAKIGTRVRRGSQLYRLDEQPVIAVRGRIPMYRDLRTGDTGADVRQLESNLAKLGYDGFTVDDEFTSYTAAAVELWQDDLGIAETGTVARSSVVFIRSGGRVDSHLVEVGDTVAPNVDVLDLTDAAQVVSLKADVTDLDLVDVGRKVTVGLPGDRQVTGTVTSAAVVGDTSGGGAGGAEDPSADDTVAQVEVTLRKPVDGSFLGSPVDVVVDTDTHKNVLVVPITALLALAEGGFGLEVVAGDGTTAIVAVQTGLFSDGMVEVEGKGIRPGTVVGVAGR